MDSSIGELNGMITALDESVEGLESSFNSNWEDAVHDSFAVYIAICKRSIEGMKEVIKDMVALQSEISSVDVDSVENGASGVIMEIDAL